MKKFLLSIACAISAIAAQAQLNQTFSSVTLASTTVGTGTWMTGGLPAGWTQYNGDNLTPTSALTTAFGTNAWITRELSYSNGTKDTVAVSTSYYNPAGISNDWLISPAFTPAAGEWLLFDGVASNGSYADGFQVKVSTSGANYANFNATPLLSIAGENTSWTTHAVNLSAYVGQSINIAIINNSNDKELLYMNNIRTKVLPANEVALLDMIPDIATYKSYTTVGGTVPVQGLIKNLGASTISSYTVKINDGTATQSFPQTGTVLPYTTSIFPVINYPISGSGIKNIKMWVELTGDMDHTNDTLTSEFGTSTFAPTHNPIFEEATGTWCGWCPRGAVFMDSISKIHPDAVLIAVHNQDPMTVTAYDDGIGAFIGGYPSVVVDRKFEIDPKDILTTYTSNKADFGVGEITLGTPTISGSTLTLKADVKMAVNTKPSYDYRLALVVTEDDVHGTTSAWDQHNYYSGAAAPSLVGAGINWDNEADPVPASKMYFDFVAKDITGGFNGVAGSLPATMTAGSTYSYTFNWTIPAGMVTYKSRANVLLISALSGEAQNGAWVGLVPNSVKNIVDESNFSVFPNPTSNYLNLDFTVNQTSDVSVVMTDLTGKVVYNNSLKSLNGNQGLVINTQSLTNGIYNLSLKTNEGTITRKVTIAH